MAIKIGIGALAAVAFGAAVIALVPRLPVANASSSSEPLDARVASTKPASEPVRLAQADTTEPSTVSALPGGASVVNLASMMSFFGSPWFHGYGAAKAGLNNLTVALAHELAPRFRVNGIAPGPVPTEKFKEVRGVTEADYPRVAREWGVPLERLGVPDDIAATALFLASTAGSWITGQTLIVAGGM